MRNYLRPRPPHPVLFRTLWASVLVGSATGVAVVEDGVAIALAVAGRGTLAP